MLQFFYFFSYFIFNSIKKMTTEENAVDVDVNPPVVKPKKNSVNLKFL